MRQGYLNIAIKYETSMEKIIYSGASECENIFISYSHTMIQPCFTYSWFIQAHLICLHGWNLGASSNFNYSKSTGFTFKRTTPQRCLLPTIQCRFEGVTTRLSLQSRPNASLPSSHELLYLFISVTSCCISSFQS